MARDVNSFTRLFHTPSRLFLSRLSGEPSALGLVSVSLSPVAFLLSGITVFECPMLDDWRAMPHPPGSTCFCV